MDPVENKKTESRPTDRTRRADGAPLQIVLAEDNPADVKLVRMALDGAGLEYAIRVVGDGAEALGLIEALEADSRAAPIDVLLLDLHLPKCDGEDILKRLRSTERYAQTPVIVMTSSDLLEDRQRAEKQAALHYFHKPSTRAEFMQLGVIVRDVLIRTAILTDPARRKGGM